MPRTPQISVPDLAGTLAVVTGASDGIGLNIARRLAEAGAELILPVRNPTKGAAAVERITAAAPGSTVSTRELDLSSLESVAALGATLVSEGRPIQILVNNAGLMTPPTRQLTVDGFELQFGTNHLGHVAFAAHLLPLLRAGKARVTTQVSLSANQNAVNWDDLEWQHDYNPMKAYSSSKIALGLWALELNRRSIAEGWGITSNLAHPGISPTNLLAAQPGMGRPKDTTGVKMIRALSRRGILFGTPESAALPAVYAVTSPDAKGGRLYGPSGIGHLSGAPADEKMYSRLTSEQDATRIWDLSARLAGVSVG
ncbi:short-chain dehydrogenase [Frondihabitans sp. PAMC 28766]|uniref:SDR family oxidoreductase n=1 Tax=Frondihabitans sp. PAMC 28766 TaxID=1795630 RepID=UPI00078D7674|nr:SDR family oxidoreductase [Frondihabitans sp. PAMC 28766]AMM21498.1 short-chain dehydrogenase [Frondihabitans sp. PAMC 28766]